MVDHELTTYHIDNYILGRLLGQGSNAKVYLGIHKSTGKRFAVKIIDKTSLLNKKVKTRLEREIALMKIIRNDYIIQVHQVYETSSQVFMILDCMDGGELYDLINKRQYLDITTTLLFFGQMLNCLSYLNSKNICHRDIKPENILLNSSLSSIKLIDFGYSCYVVDETLKEFCGSPEYIAPEVIENKPFNPFLADVYSCGVLLHVMLYGQYPNTNSNKFPDNYGSGDLLFKMLQKDPNKRISLQNVMKHPFINSSLSSVIEYPITIPNGSPIELINSDLINVLSDILPNLHVSRIRDLLIEPFPNTVKEMYRLLDSSSITNPNDYTVFRDTSTLKTLFATPTHFPIIKCEVMNEHTCSSILFTTSKPCSEINLKQKINDVLNDLGVVDSNYFTVDKKMSIIVEISITKTENGYQICCNGSIRGSMFDDICELFRLLITE